VRLVLVAGFHHGSHKVVTSCHRLLKLLEVLLGVGAGLDHRSGFHNVRYLERGVWGRGLDEFVCLEVTWELVMVMVLE